MKDLIENNKIRFTNISQKKDAFFVNFKVKGIRNGVQFSASISVDISTLDLDLSDPLEKIVETCAKVGVKEFKGASFKFEGIENLETYLGVAQLG